MKPRPPPLPVPPHPDLWRRPDGPFGWLDARLLRDGWLARLGPEAVATLSFLALAADRRGASFHGRDRMALALALDRNALDRALDRLLRFRLVAFRPWRPGADNGIWQILPVPPPPSSACRTAPAPTPPKPDWPPIRCPAASAASRRSTEPVLIRDILRERGYLP